LFQRSLTRFEGNVSESSQRRTLIQSEVLSEIDRLSNNWTLERGDLKQIG